MKSTIMFGLLLANVALIECNRKIPPGTDKCLPMKKVEVKQLKCGTKKIISDIAIRSFVASKCVDTGGCSGLQVDVLKTSNLCYWKRKCKLTLSSKSPLIQTSNRSCIGKFPSSLSVRYSCVKIESVTYFQSDLTQNIEVKNVTSDSGILVSHIDYPWLYLDNLNLLVRLRPKTQKFTHLYLWKRSYDINAGDRFRARTESGDFQEFSKLSTVFTWSPVELEFVTADESPRGPGFIICYRWGQANKENTEDFTCGKKKKRGPKGGRETRKPKKNRNRKNRNKGKRRKSRGRDKKKGVDVTHKA